MSFIIKGGYDFLTKKIINVSLKRTTIWHNGIVMLKNNMFVCSLYPQNENKFEIVNYNNKHTLLLNNTIVYESPKLFTYDIDLKVDIDAYIKSGKNIHSCIDCAYINYGDLKKINVDRCLN